MLQIPEEIADIMRKVEDSGERVYVTGGSLRDCLRGAKPGDWDLSTTAAPEKMKELFPESKVIGERFGVLRVKSGELQADLAALREETGYSDYRRPDRVMFTDQVEKDLVRRDFTINAMAMGTDGILIDPCGGARDLEKHLIRAVGDPAVRFEEDPLRILRGIRFAARLNFDIEIRTFEGMQTAAPLLTEISMERRRDEFEWIITSRNAGKGLRMCVAAGVMPAIVGNCFPPSRRQEHGDFQKLIQNIDKCKKETRKADLRMAMLLLCFEPSKAEEAVRNLKYSRETTKKLMAAIRELTPFWFAGTGELVKKFIYKHGWDVYYFLNELTKMERDIYDCAATRIESKYYILEEIKRYREPIFVEDLAISCQDLIDEGIAEGAEAGMLLTLLVERTHRLPGLNTRAKLLKKAKELKRNPFARKGNGIHWLR